MIGLHCAPLLIYQLNILYLATSGVRMVVWTSCVISYIHLYVHTSLCLRAPKTYLLVCCYRSVFRAGRFQALGTMVTARLSAMPADKARKTTDVISKQLFCLFFRCDSEIILHFYVIYRLHVMSDVRSSSVTF